MPAQAARPFLGRSGLNFTYVRKCLSGGGDCSLWLCCLVHCLGSTLLHSGPRGHPVVLMHTNRCCSGLKAGELLVKRAACDGVRSRFWLKIRVSLVTWPFLWIWEACPARDAVPPRSDAQHADEFAVLS